MHIGEEEQYVIGLKAGKILRKIHSVPVVKADMTTPDWNEWYGGFIEKSINDFRRSGLRVENAEFMLDYFNESRHLLKERPQGYIHGDCYIGNMMITCRALCLIGI